MKKSKWSFFIVCFIFLFACNDAKTQSLEAFYQDVGIEHIDKVVLVDGSTGYAKRLVEQQKIDEFLALIKNIEYSLQENQEPRVGWRYGIRLYDGKKLFNFTLNEIDSVYYDTNPDIHPIIDAFYTQLDVEEVPSWKDL